MNEKNKNEIFVDFCFWLNWSILLYAPGIFTLQQIATESGFPQKNKIKIPGLSRIIFLIFQDIYL